MPSSRFAKFLLPLYQTKRPRAVMSAANTICSIQLRQPLLPKAIAQCLRRVMTIQNCLNATFGCEVRRTLSSRWATRWWDARERPGASPVIEFGSASHKNNRPPAHWSADRDIRIGQWPGRCSRRLDGYGVTDRPMGLPSGAPYRDQPPRVDLEFLLCFLASLAFVGRLNGTEPRLFAGDSVDDP